MIVTLRNLLLAALLAFMSLHMGAFAEEPLVLPPDPTPLRVETAGEVAEFTIEIADDPVERARGLMHREQLEPDHGMLFVFEHTGRQSFWMRDTPLPLDLVFISENGRVVAILPGEPFSTAQISPVNPVRFVLELNRGTAVRRGMAIGDRVRHPALDLRRSAGAPAN